MVISTYVYVLKLQFLKNNLSFRNTFNCLLVGWIYQIPIIVYTEKMMIRIMFN